MIKIWDHCNIYGSTLGNDVSVGFGSEIGNAIIGDNVRIGAMSFICEGVTIENDVFIAPRVTFTNDKYPPSDKSKWQKTIVKQKASIGAGCVILCGVTIGEGAKIGAGSVVTKNVPAGELWIGSPARKVNHE
jgi:UDP-2-acetamido-3-amino-2,3-dideoxy-glucuronate N-acetyltransferase